MKLIISNGFVDNSAKGIQQKSLAEGDDGGPGGFAPWRVQGGALVSLKGPPEALPAAYLLAFSQKSGQS